MARSRDPKIFSTILVEICQLLGMEEARQQYKTLHIWSSVVGEAISEATILERFSGGQLFIRVKNPTWRMELNYRKQDIINKLNKMLEQPLVKEIIFR